MGLSKQLKTLLQMLQIFFRIFSRKHKKVINFKKSWEKMATLNERKRKGKGKFFMNAKKAKYAICPGQRGFLGYCNKFERESIKEARILFDEYSLKINKDQDEEKSDESEVDEFDAADAEQEEMKKQSEQEVDSFQLMNSGVQNVLFFKTKMKDPVKFSQIIMDDIISNGEQKTRFLMRLVPIEATCKAHEQNVTEAMKKLLQKHFSKENPVKTYCVVFKSRCNHDFKKEMTYKIVGDIIKELSPESKVEYKTPDFVIMVEVMKSNCCLAVLPKYFDTYKKCNLIELSKLKKISSEKEIKIGEDTIETAESDKKIESSESKEKADINVEIPLETESQS